MQEEDHLYSSPEVITVNFMQGKEKPKEKRDIYAFPMSMAMVQEKSFGERTAKLPRRVTRSAKDHEGNYKLRRDGRLSENNGASEKGRWRADSMRITSRYGADMRVPSSDVPTGNKQDRV